MTSISTYGTAPADLRRNLVPIGAAVTVASWALNAVGIFLDGTEGGEPRMREFLVVSGFTLVAVALVFGLVVPRALRRPATGGAALTLSAMALLLIFPAFWSGVIPALATGGVLLGWHGRTADRRAGLAQAAVAVGLLAGVALVAIYVLDYLHTHGVW